MIKILTSTLLTLTLVVLSVKESKADPIALLCNGKVLAALALPANIASLVGEISGQFGKDVARLNSGAVGEFANDAMKEFGKCARKGKHTSVLNNFIGSVDTFFNSAPTAMNRCTDTVLNKIQNSNPAALLADFGKCMKQQNSKLLNSLGALVDTAKLLQDTGFLIQDALNKNVLQAGLNCFGGMPNPDAIMNYAGNCVGKVSGVASLWEIYEKYAGNINPEQILSDAGKCVGEGLEAGQEEYLGTTQKGMQLALKTTGELLGEAGRLGALGEYLISAADIETLMRACSDYRLATKKIRKQKNKRAKRLARRR